MTSPRRAFWLRVAGVALLVGATAIVLVDGASGGPSDYEQGKVVGVAIRNVVLGLVLAGVVVLLLRRARGESASWQEVTPVGLLGGGVIALALALAFGAPQTSEERTQSAAKDCQSSEPNPIGGLRANQRSELTDRQLQRLYAGRDVPSGFFESSSTYFAGTQRAPV